MQSDIQIYFKVCIYTAYCVLEVSGIARRFGPEDAFIILTLLINEAFFFVVCACVYA